MRSVAAKAESIGGMMAYSLAPLLYFGDPQALEPVMQSARQNPDLLYVVITAPDGRLLGVLEPGRARLDGFRRGRPRLQPLTRRPRLPRPRLHHPQRLRGGPRLLRALPRGHATGCEPEPPRHRGRELRRVSPRDGRRLRRERPHHGAPEPRGGDGPADHGGRPEPADRGPLARRGGPARAGLRRHGGPPRADAGGPGSL